MTLAINLILAASVFAVIVGMLAWAVVSSKVQPEARLARARAPRERSARQAAYRSVSGQA